MDEDYYTCGTCKHGNLADTCRECEDAYVLYARGGKSTLLPMAKAFLEAAPSKAERDRRKALLLFYLYGGKMPPITPSSNGK